MRLQRDVGRSCGECNACCKPFRVQDASKEGGDLCHHCIVSKGCSIYEDRPQVCKDFACLWLNGSGEDDYRPDRLGVMIDLKELPLGSRRVGAIDFWETRVGVIGQTDIEELAESYVDNGLVVNFRRIKTENTYSIQSLFDPRLYSEKEVEMIKSKNEQTE